MAGRGDVFIKLGSYPSGELCFGGDRVVRGGLYLSMNSERLKEEGSVKGGVYRGDRD